MKNYVIRVPEEDQQLVLGIVRSFSNDIQIDHVNGPEIGVTIELEDDESDELFSSLQREITLTKQRSDAAHRVEP